MKQFLLLLAIFIQFPLFAQEGTTLDEYRYMSKGYIYQLEMGLDANKEGYLVKNLFEASNGAALVGLYQIGNAAPRALLVILDNGTDIVNYVCLPNAAADARVKELAESDQRNFTVSLKSKYQNALNEFLFEALSNPDLKSLSYGSEFPSQGMLQKDETLVSRSANLENYIDHSEKPTKIQADETALVSKTPERTVSGEIANRKIIHSEVLKTDSKKKGTISIKVCVDQEGEVKTAKFTQLGSTTFDAYLQKIALEAAKKIKFAKLDNPEQCGIINYVF